MKQKLFEISGNQITLFPNEIWKIAGFAVGIAFPVCWLVFLIWAGMLQWLPVIVMAFSNLVMVLPFFYVGSRQIVVDGATQTVQRTSWFGIRKRCTFSDIEEVLFVNVVVYNSRTSGYYKLTLKKTPYGKGIQLSMGMSKTAKQFAMLQNTAIPFIKKLLATDSSYTNRDKRNWIETEAAGFKMFHQKNGTFLSKPLKTVNLVVAILLFAIGLFVMYHFLINPASKKEYYWLLAFLAAIVNIGIWGQRVKIKPVEKTIEKSYIGLFRKTFVYKRIVGFNTLRHVNGLDNPTDIRIEMDNGISVQQITLFSKVGSAKKVQILMDELKRILSA